MRSARNKRRQRDEAFSGLDELALVGLQAGLLEHRFSAVGVGGSRCAIHTAVDGVSDILECNAG